MVGSEFRNFFLNLVNYFVFGANFDDFVSSQFLHDFFQFSFGESFLEIGIDLGKESFFAFGTAVFIFGEPCNDFFNQIGRVSGNGRVFSGVEGFGKGFVAASEDVKGFQMHDERIEAGVAGDNVKVAFRIGH